MRGVEVKRIYVGTFMTSLEMAGVSLTLLHLNEERLKYLGNYFPVAHVKLVLYLNKLGPLNFQVFFLRVTIHLIIFARKLLKC